MCTHPAPTSHVSSVHPSPSSQFTAVCWQAPVPALHVSVVHAFASSQFTFVPPVQEPPLQASPVVQALPSLQAAVLFAWAHPDAGTQESSVHAFESSQLSAVPPTHDPPLQ